MPCPTVRSLTGAAMTAPAVMFTPKADPVSWVCARCKRSNAPHLAHCDCTDGQSAGADDRQGMLLLGLPPHMWVPTDAPTLPPEQRHYTGSPPPIFTMSGSITNT